MTVGMLAVAAAILVGEPGMRDVGALCASILYPRAWRWVNPYHYEAALPLDPQSPAGAFSLALQSLPLGWSLDLTEPAGEGKSFRTVTSRPTSGLPLGKLDEARRAFVRCGQLAPENSACDYLAALLAFNEGQRSQGDAYLRAAIGKGGFDLYEREAASSPVYS